MIFIRTAFGGVALGAKAITNLANSLHGFAFLIITCVIIYYLSVYVPKLIFAIRDYENVTYPYKVVSFFYHWFFNLISLITTGPFKAGAWVFDFNLTQYKNLNFILGLITGISLYILTFSTLIYSIKMSKQSLLKLISYVLIPAVIALIYFLLASFFQWTFSEKIAKTTEVETVEIFNSDELQNQNLETIDNVIPTDTPLSNPTNEITHRFDSQDKNNEPNDQQVSAYELPLVKAIEEYVANPNELEHVNNETNCSPAERSLNQC